MTQLDVDMQAYRITEEQKAAMHRLVRGKPDAEELLRMLGVIEEEQVNIEIKKTVNLKCSTHNEYKYRSASGKVVCRSCRKASDKKRRERNK